MKTLSASASQIETASALLESAERNTPMLQLSAELFRERFNKVHFPVEHGLTGHPLFTLPRLLELAKDTQRERPEDLYYDAGVHDITERWGSKPCEFSVEDALRRIETCGAWIILKCAERDPAYAKLLDRCIADLLQASGPELKKKIRRQEMIIFITSPRRVTTYHIDSESNFLLQIQGRKEINVFRRDDRKVLSEPEIERFWTVDNNAAIYKPELQHHADVITLTPGHGLHIPVNAPHWLRNDNNISISASINYHSWYTEFANIYCLNYYLRHKFGMNPTPPNHSPWLDHLKRPIGGILKHARDWHHGPVRKY